MIYSYTAEGPAASLGVSEPSPVSERQMVQQWLGLLPGTVLYDREGHPLLVLDPGRRNRHAGPDILGAKFFYQQSYVTGDVECHLHENDWWMHNHHRDPRYASVVLHVVRWVATRRLVHRPTVVFPQRSRSLRTCRLTSQNLVTYPERPLWWCSIRRWWQKVQFFQTQRANDEAVLLETGFRILGAGGNEAAFTQLARTISQLPHEAFTTRDIKLHLSEAYTRLSPLWQRRGVRPNHRPSRRLKLAAALAYFLHDWRADYYRSPADFQRDFKDALTPKGGTTILTELLGNVFYPYLGGRALQTQDLIVYQHWYGCWYRLTLHTGYGKYRRQFEPLLGRALLRPYWVWQGFLYLDKTFCAHRHCNLCPLKKDHGRLD